MSKELIERLRHDRYDWLRSQAADRIEELERERDALLADNARLREALQWIAAQKASGAIQVKAIEALAATPAQSLARIRNQVREECAELFGDTVIGREAAALIRDMKEPE